MLVRKLHDSLLECRVSVVNGVGDGQLDQSDSDEFVSCLFFGSSWVLDLFLVDVVNEIAGGLAQQQPHLFDGPQIASALWHRTLVVPVKLNGVDVLDRIQEVPFLLDDGGLEALHDVPGDLQIHDGVFALMCDIGRVFLNQAREA